MLGSLLITVKVIWVLSAVKAPLGVMVNSGVIWAAATVTGWDFASWPLLVRNAASFSPAVSASENVSVCSPAAEALLLARNVPPLSTQSASAVPASYFFSTM